jgi:PhnO protein
MTPKILEVFDEHQNSVYELICELEETTIPREIFNMIFITNSHLPTVRYRIAWMDQKVVGFCSVHIQHLLHHWSLVAEVQELVVDKAYRGKGIGKHLLNDAIAFAKQQGCTQIELSTNRKRLDAQRFYEREGWTSSHLKYTFPL